MVTFMTYVLFFFHVANAVAAVLVPERLSPPTHYRHPRYLAIFRVES